MDPVETRRITLPNGNPLEIEIMPGFLDRVRQHFGLVATDPVSDYHVRMFFFGAVKRAVDRVEQD